jgi:hypothetical protein
MSRRFGVIVEDKTDGDVVRVVIHRSAGKLPVKIRAQKGCSRIKTKAARVIADLIAQDAVTDIIVLHDLDRHSRTNELNDEAILLSQIAACCGFQETVIRRLICIPVEELEAWFWADPEVVKRIGRGKGEAHPEPHRIVRPKEKLQHLSCGANAKPRYSTQDNPSLAETLDLSLCARVTVHGVDCG